MKKALLLSGYIGTPQKANSNSNTPIPIEKQDIYLQMCYNHWKKHLFNKEDVDVFIHSWDYKCKDVIIKYFNPKKIEVEPGMENSKIIQDFEHNIRSNNINTTTKGRIHQIYGYKT